MPRSTREKTAETHEIIVEAALQLFVSQGYHATSMREIAARAQLTVGALYNHFSDKEQIWLEVLLVRHPYRDVLPKLISIQTDNVEDMFYQAAHIMVAELEKRPELMNLMLIEIVEHNLSHVLALAQIIMPQLAGLYPLLTAKNDKLRDIPYPILFRSFIGLFFSYYVTGILITRGAGIGADDNALDKFIDLYLHGVLKEQA